MTTLASALISKAKILAQDTGNIRWADAEWLGWASDGQREICIVRPPAFSKIANVTMVAGTKQAIPTDGVTFLEYMRSMGAGGATPGLTARKVPRRLLDGQNPGWHAVTAVAVPTHYVFEPLAPKVFYVYPPSTGAQQCEILYAASPPDIATIATAISLDDIYGSVLIDYMLYRGYSKDAELIGNAERSMLSRKAFENALGLKERADAGTVAAANERG